MGNYTTPLLASFYTNLLCSSNNLLRKVKVKHYFTNSLFNPVWNKFDLIFIIKLPGKRVITQMLYICAIVGIIHTSIVKVSKKCILFQDYTKQNVRNINLSLKKTN